MSRYLKVCVFRNDLGDSSLSGITSNPDLNLYVEIKRGNLTLDDVKMNNGIILKPKPKPFESDSPCSFVEDVNDGKWRSFGGNFVWSSDSRFRDKYPSPIAVHDRIEG